MYGMEWHVKLLLRPGSTVLEERVRLRNRSDVRHRFYWWNNAAVRVSDDSKMAPIVDAPRAEYLVGTAYATCGRTQEAEAKFQVASKASTPDQVLWAWLAAQKLPGFDGTVWQERLQSASADAEGRTQIEQFCELVALHGRRDSGCARKQERSRYGIREGVPGPRPHDELSLHTFGAR